jgi:hypothetical protein
MFKKKDGDDKISEEVRFVSRRSTLVHSPKRSNLGVKDVKSTQGKSYWKPNASINNIEYEKKKEVDYEISEQNKRRRRRSRVRATLKLSLVGFTMLALFLILGLSARRVSLRVEGVEVGTDYYNDLSSYVSGSVGGGLLGYVHPSFFRYEELEESTIEEREDVGELDLKFNIWKLRTEATISPNIPLVKWVGSEGKVSYVNQKGLIFSPPEELIRLYGPVELGGSGIGVEEGSGQLARSDKLSWVVSMIPILKEQGIVLERVNIDASSFRIVEVYAEGLEFRVIFSVDEDPAQSAIAAARSIKYLQKGRAEDLDAVEYVDVRTPERVVYR